MRGVAVPAPRASVCRATRSASAHPPARPAADPTVANRTDVEQRRAGRRVDEDVEIAVGGALAAQYGTGHPCVAATVRLDHATNGSAMRIEGL